MWVALENRKMIFQEAPRPHSRLFYSFDQLPESVEPCRWRSWVKLDHAAVFETWHQSVAQDFLHDILPSDKVN